MSEFTPLIEKMQEAIDRIKKLEAKNKDLSEELARCKWFLSEKNRIIDEQDAIIAKLNDKGFVLKPFEYYLNNITKLESEIDVNEVKEFYNKALELAKEKCIFDDYLNTDCDDCKHCFCCINCSDCKHCFCCEHCDECKDCTSCSGCEYCKDCECCTSCEHCRLCNECHYCNDCVNCVHCHECGPCHDCTTCEVCADCGSCENCSFCEDCDDCKKCEECKYCNGCKYCNDCEHRENYEESDTED